MKTLISLLTVALIIVSCQSLEINHITNIGAGTGDGIYYALPMTVLTVEVPVTEVTLKPGVCFCKDERLMRSKGKIINELIKLKKGKVQPNGWEACDTLVFDTTSYTYYKMGDINISSYPVPDSSKIYHVRSRKNVLKKNNLTFVLNELSVMNSAEIKIEDRTLDVITQVVGSVVEIAGKFFKGSTDENKDKKTFCEELKEHLDELNKGRKNLIANMNSQTSIETLKKQLEEIDNARETIIAQFTYTESKETSTIKIDRVILPAQLNTWLNLFAFDKASGLKVLPIPKAGYTNYYSNNGIATVASAEKNLYALRVEDYGNQMPGYAGRNPVGLALNGEGLAYNVPKKVAIKIAKLKAGTSKSFIEDKPIASSNLLMPQFGKVAFLRKKQSLSSIELDPNTGALRKVVLENNPVTADQIKNVGSAVGGIAGFKKTELSKLQDESGVLEQKEKILKLKISIDSLSKKAN